MNFHLPCVLHQNNMEYTTFIYKMQAFFHIFFRFFSKSPQTLYFLNFLHALIVSSRFRIQHTVCILRPRFISFRFRQGFEYTAFVSLKPHFFLPIRDSGMYLTTIVCTGISFFYTFLLFLFWWFDDHAADWISHRRKLLFILRHDITLRILAMMQVKRIVDHLPTGKFYLFQ